MIFVGLDYVAHEDILPYTSLEQTPIQHELFDKFLSFNQEKECFEAQDTLRAWQQKNHPWLELSDVHKETTEVIYYLSGIRKFGSAQFECSWDELWGFDSKVIYKKDTRAKKGGVILCKSDKVRKWVVI